MEIIPVALLTDNYAFLVHHDGTTLVIDPSEDGPVADELDVRGWKPTAILNTHHHGDHTGGNRGLKQRYACEVIVPQGDGDRIGGCDREMADGQTLKWRGLSVEVLGVPGHTRNHVALWLPAAPAVFTGDTLFLMGCGRLFEGTAQQLQTSLQKLSQLPSDTLIYCGHEYTQANATFALSLTPHDPAVVARAEQVASLRAQGRSTLPGTVGEERKTNPFMRLTDEPFREKLFLGMSVGEAFAELRRRQDHF